MNFALRIVWLVVGVIATPPAFANRGRLGGQLQSALLSTIEQRVLVDEALFWNALRNPDEEMRTIAIGALTGTHSTSTIRARAAAWLLEEWTAIADLEERLLSPRVQVVHGGLRRLLPYTHEPDVAKVFTKLLHATQVEDSAVKHRYTPAILRPVLEVRRVVALGLTRRFNEKRVADLRL